MSNVDVVVVGGGLIGLGIAWRCAQGGLRVTVSDSDPGSGASGTAAGMLAPATELSYDETELLRLNLASAARFPDWVAELREVTGHDVDYQAKGTVVAAWDQADLAVLKDLHAFQLRHGLRSEVLTGRQLRRLEDQTSPGLPGGLLAPDDHQVDPQRLHAALLSAATAAGVRIVPGTRRILRHGDRVTGVELDDGGRCDAGSVVLAAGAWSRTVPGLDDDAGRPPVRPVKGQVLVLRGDGEPLLRHVVRGLVRGSPVYLVQRGDGRVIVGASSEEAGFDVTARAGAVYELLRDAQALVPAVGELRLERVSTSLRPGTPDNAPVIGPAEPPGLVLATGHYRHGVLLTPATADGVAALLLGGRLPEPLAAFSPQRFRETHRTEEIEERVWS